MTDKISTKMWLSSSSQELEESMGDGFEQSMLDGDYPQVLLAANESIAFNEAALSLFSATSSKELISNLDHLQWLGPVQLSSGFFENYSDKLNRLKSHGAQEFEVYLPRTNGELYLETKFKYINNSGVTGILVCFHDVTMFRKLMMQQDELLCRERSESYLKSQFITNLSHEIRTPLNGVVGYTAILAETGLTQEQLNILEGIDSSGSELSNVINDILDFSLLNMGAIEFNFHSFDIHAQLESCVGKYLQSASDKGVNLDLDIHSDVPRFIKSDRERLQKVVNNILSFVLNISKKGQIKLLLGVKGRHDENLNLDIKVQEKGTVLDDSFLRDLSRSFSTGDFSKVKKFQGSGIDLPLCLSLVRALDGQINCSNSEFLTISLKLKAKVGLHIIEGGKNTKSIPRIPKNLNILVVDDKVVNSEIARFHLDKVGANIDLAENGLEALDMAAKKKYDICFMDCQMPVMNGYEATGKMLEILGEDRPYIIAMTANVMAGDREKCFEAGMDDYISKPIKNLAVLRSLEKGVAFKAKNTSTDAKKSPREKLLKTQKLPQSSTIDRYLEELKLFESDYKLNVARLEQAFKNNNVEDQVNISSELKSSCLKIGFEVLAKHFLQAEILLKSGNGYQLDQDKIFFFNIVMEDELAAYKKTLVKGLLVG